MDITIILIMAAVAVAVRLASIKVNRIMLLLTASILAVYWLQPALPIRYLDFWLPTMVIGLVVIGWVITTPAAEYSRRENLLTAGWTALLIILLAGTRYLGYQEIITASRPPQILQVLIALGFTAAIVLLLTRTKGSRAPVLWGYFALILLIFILIKTPDLALAASRGLHALMGQNAGRAAAVDIRWLGYSYIAFRLIHTVRDRQSGRLPVVGLGEYVVYMLFFPALSAGPIDRVERFVTDLRKPLQLSAEDFLSGGRRIILGMFKKFVVADALALLAINRAAVLQTTGDGWLLLMLYAYSFQIFFDFSGYTDIAIGLGRFMGINLPENFNRPYRQVNLTQFWNNWHMTLTQWLRAYVFFPMTRRLRRGKRKLPGWSIILITQVVTMGMIGLWHGITPGFLIWGLWHGFGLFIQNRWSDWIRPKVAVLNIQPAGQKLLTATGVLLTFHYVTLGWAWFALPEVADAWHVLVRLFS